MDFWLGQLSAIIWNREWKWARFQTGGEKYVIRSRECYRCQCQFGTYLRYLCEIPVKMLLLERVWTEDMHLQVLGTQDTMMGMRLLKETIGVTVQQQKKMECLGTERAHKGIKIFKVHQRSSCKTRRNQHYWNQGESKWRYFLTVEFFSSSSESFTFLGSRNHVLNFIVSPSVNSVKGTS